MSAAPVEIGVVEAAAMLRADSGLVVIDVRESWEREICAVPGTIHVPMDDIPAQAGRFDPEKPILIMCHHGGRSLNVTRWLRSKGFLRAINVGGGIHAWSIQVDPGMAQY